MLVSTEPRAMFQYSMVPIVVLLTVIVVLIVALVMVLRGRRKPQNLPKVERVIVKVDLAQVRAEYLAKIDDLIRDFKGGKLNNRQSYQRLSQLIRQFIFKVTDIKVQNYTLNEIRALKIDSLTELVAEYYSPEFAPDSHGNFMVSVAKTRKVIELWH